MPSYGDGWDFFDPIADVDVFQVPPDWQTADGDLAAQNQLHSAVIIQIFTEARAPADSPFIDNPEDRRGWWGDAYSPFPVGSLLWTLYRQPLTDSVIEHARSYTRDAIQRLVDQGAAARQECAVVADKPRATMTITPQLFGRDGSIIYSRQFRRYWVQT
ncbi:Phage protein GP46 [Paraburkholderia tuberum]|uniref:Phage protein GP46 n=1 Tax=Paraburkholderia tuberum TaxID=157910 RepID=A0A1H1JSH9_9BURK|nr:Phage protein GP46 [Paraburkholderia tuberum]